jgi:hypothetical protein
MRRAFTLRRSTIAKKAGGIGESSTMFWTIVASLAGLATIIFAWFWWQFRKHGAYLEKEIEELKLGPEYAEINRMLANGQIRLDQAMMMRKVALRARQIEREIANAKVPQGQAVVIVPATEIDREACETLFKRNKMLKSPNGDSFTPVQ